MGAVPFLFNHLEEEIIEMRRPEGKLYTNEELYELVFGERMPEEPTEPTKPSYRLDSFTHSLLIKKLKQYGNDPNPQAL